MAQPFRDEPSGTAMKTRMTGEDRSRTIEFDVAEVSEKEAVAESSEASTAAQKGRQASPVDELKHRLSLWGESHTQPADSDEEGSEYELLLDPNLPDEYLQQPSNLGLTRTISLSSSFDEEKTNKIYNEDGIEEDSPYPEVRAAVRNYDIDVPCNTVSIPKGTDYH